MPCTVQRFTFSISLHLNSLTKHSNTPTGVPQSVSAHVRVIYNLPLNHPAAVSKGTNSLAARYGGIKISEYTGAASAEYNTHIPDNLPYIIFPNDIISKHLRSHRTTLN